MFRINPGPFEPFVYFVQTRPFYRLVAVGGFALFTIFALHEAALDGGAMRSSSSPGCSRPTGSI